MEKRNKLARFAGAFASTTLISRILGFARDMIVGSIFGAGLYYDAFLVALKAPNTLRRLFAEGAFAQAFVPLLAEYQTTRSPQETQLLIDKVAGSLAFVLFWITLVGVIGAPLLIYVFAPGFESDSTRWQLSIDMLRITFPYLFFISLTAFAGSVLNTYGKFAIPGLTPIWLNIVMIIGAIYVAPYFAEPIMALAWSVFIAGIIQLLFQIPFLWKIGVVPRFRWGFNDPGVKRLLMLMVPIIFGSSVAQLNLMLGTLFASFLPVGSLSWLYFAERLMEFPLGIFGVALATAILPELSREHATHNPKRYSATLDWALRSVFIIGLPAAIGLGILAGPVITTLFHYGAITTSDVHAITPALEALALGVLAFMLVKILAGAFYAQQDVRTPVKIAVYTVVVNMALNLLLMPWLAHVGLALATAISAFFNGMGLLLMLWYRGYYTPMAGWGRFSFQMGMAISAMLAFLLWGMGDINDWLTAVWWERLSYLIGLIGGAIVIYFIVLRLCGLNMKQLLSPQQAAETSHSLHLIRHVKSTDFSQGCVATIGSFDGVHRGHIALLKQLAQEAKQLKVPGVVVIFEPHPREVLTPDKAPVRLTSLREKIRLLEQLPIDYVVCLRFDKKLSSLTAEEFAQNLLVNQLQVKSVIIGDDFRFGKNRQGDFTLLQDLGKQYQFKVQSLHTIENQGQRISSTLIRAALAQGDLESAQQMLGRPYSIGGHVRRGAGRGRQWGFPTANIKVPERGLPLNGVFVVRVSSSALRQHPAVANIGTRPTVDGTHTILEVLLLDFDGDLYGQYLQIEFIKKLRPEQKFATPELLIAQIREDVEQARKFFDL